MEKPRVNLHGFFKSLLLALTVLLLATPTSLSAAEKNIKIGIMGPMKLIYGQQILWGTTMAAEEINAAGGINVNGVRHNIELVEADDNCFLSVVDAVNAMERLVTVEKVALVIGGIRSESILAQQEVMADNKVVFLTSAGGSPELTTRVAKDYNRYKYFFRACISGKWTAQIGIISVDMAVKKMRKELGVQKPRVALFAEKILTWEPLIKVIPGILEKMGAELAGVWQPSAVATDVRAELEAIEGAGSHIIFQLFSSPVGIAASRQWGELQVPAVPVGANIESGRWKHWKDTNGKCEYNISMSPFARVTITDKTTPFVNKFFERHGDMPMWVSQSYDALFLVKEAIERAGGLDSDKLVVELEKTDYMGAQGRLAFTPTSDQFPHEFVWKPGYTTWVLTQWQAGEQAVIWPNGDAAFGVPGYEGVKYPGTGEFKFPPWVISYWKDKGK